MRGRPLKFKGHIIYKCIGFNPFRPGSRRAITFDSFRSGTRIETIAASPDANLDDINTAITLGFLYASPKPMPAKEVRQILSPKESR